MTRGHPDTRWYDLAFRTALMQHHNVSVNGGSEQVRYMASLGYLGQSGILPNAKRNQFNARTNLDLTLSRLISARLGLSSSRISTQILITPTYLVALIRSSAS